LTRIFLIGAGPYPGEGTATGFPTLRTRQFLLACLRAGHEVRWAMLVAAQTDPGWGAQGQSVRVELKDGERSHPCEVVTVRADEPGRFLMLRDLRHDHAPDVVVTAGPFLPMGAGARAVAAEPLWVDVPGDPMAEAQARAFRDGTTLAIQRYREMYGLALARGDRFSVISGAQRAAAIGALGLAGRLRGEILGEDLVAVVPGSVEGADPETGAEPAAIRTLPRDAFVVFSAGGFNTWLDEETMAESILRALDREPRLHFLSTGGGLQGHDEGTYARFAERLRSSPHQDRVHLLGWVDDRDLPAIWARADLCLLIDRPCAEAELGARTRVLSALGYGLAVAATPTCEMVRALVGAEGFLPLPCRDAAATAQILVEAAAAGRRRWSHRHLLAPYSIDRSTTPLTRWLQDPRRAPGGVGVDFLEESWQEVGRLQDRLEEVWNSPTWRTLGRLHRAMLGRRS
jgi:glycosyltransferase involved in cell wall biosynthesis